MSRCSKWAALVGLNGVVHFKSCIRREGGKPDQKKLENAAMLSQTWHGVKRYVVYRFKNFRERSAQI